MGPNRVGTRGRARRGSTPPRQACPVTRIRVACFGAGWVTTHRHIPAMRAHGGYDVVAIVDRRIERAREGAAVTGVPHAFVGASVTDVPELEGLRIDAVTCGTAPFAHFQVVASALDAGKHVITEKPFTMTVGEGEDLVARALHAGSQLAVVHNFQFARSVREVDDWRRRGRLGELRAVWATQWSNPHRRLPTWYDELPLGLFYDESPHLLYLLRHFADPALELDAVSVVPAAVPGRNTPTQITAQYRGTIPATLAMNFDAPLSEWHVALLGERAAAVVDVFRDIALLVPNDRSHDTWSVLRSSSAATVRHWWGYLRSGPRHLRGDLRYGNEEVFARFAAAVRTGVAPRGISADDALAVVRAQHEIVDAASRVR